MVNRGGPSKACQECRRRKIRCDLQRPECSQCTRVGKRCPGYRNLDDIIFRPYQSTEGEDPKSEASTSGTSGGQSSTSREELAFVTSPVETSAGPSSRGRARSSPVSLASGEESPTGGVSQSPQRYLGPPSWDHQAVSCFMGQFTFTPSPGGTSFGWFDFLPDQLLHSSESSPLRPTVQAIAYASLAGQSALGWLRIEARKHYGQALVKINEALKNPETAVDDDVLSSVILAGFYENIAGDSLNIMGSHRMGTSMLLKLRGTQQFSTARGRSLFRHACSMHRIFAYNTGTRPLPIIEAYRSTGRTDPVGPGGSSALSAMTDQLAGILVDFKEFYTAVHSPEEFAAGMADYLSHFETLHNDLRERMNSFDSNWCGYRYDSIPSITGGPQPPYVLTYTDTWKMGTSNLCRSILVFLNELMYLCHAALDEPTLSLFPESATVSSPRATACIDAVRHYIDEILASVPYILDDIDTSANLTTDQAPKSGIKAFVSIWVLWIVKSSALAEKTQIAYAEGALTRIANMWGIQLAVWVASLQKYDRFGVMHRGEWLEQASAS